MIAKEPKRLKVKPNTTLLDVLDRLARDGEPRILERDGEDVAVMVTPGDYSALKGEAAITKTKRLRDFAGAWKDIDADALIERIYRARHESPPSKPVKL